MTKELEKSDLYEGRRVYVGDLDVFGKVAKKGTVIICEPPMPGYEFPIAGRRRPIYDESIGDR